MKDREPISFKVKSGLIFATEAFKKMVRDNKGEAEEHEFQSGDFDHDDSPMRELSGPLDRIKQPTADQYLPGVGQEIELFFAPKAPCE